MSFKILVISNYQSFHTVRPEAEIFIGLAKMGVEVHIMTQENSEYGKRFKEVGIKVINFHPQKKKDAEEILIIRKQLIEENYDILQLFNNKAILAGIAAAKDLAIKVVLYRGYTGNISWLDPIAYLKFLHPRVDNIICNSIGVEQHLHKQKYFDKSKTKVINKGHKLDWYKSVKPMNIRKEFGIPDNAFVIVNVANNRTMKGIPYLLQAIHALPKKDVNVHLLILGGGMDTTLNQRIIKRGRHKDKITLTGLRNDALSIVKSADAFVLSSIKGESITKSVLEAMSLGTAPIITDIAGNVELVDNGVTGVVVKKKNYKSLADGILKLYENRDLCTQMGKKSQERIASNFNSEKTIQEYFEFYTSIL